VHCLLPLFITSLVKKESHFGFLYFASPSVALKATYHQHVQPIKRRFTIVTVLDMICKHALAVSIGWSLGKRARAGDVALADVKPISQNFPIGNQARNPSTHPFRLIIIFLFAADYFLPSLSPPLFPLFISIASYPKIPT
jgi:hypothetical protein